MDCQYNLYTSKVWTPWTPSTCKCVKQRRLFNCMFIFCCCRPVRGSDPLASPAGDTASPGNWMFAMPSASAATPFSPAQTTYDMHSRAQQHHLHSKHMSQLRRLCHTLKSQTAAVVMRHTTNMLSAQRLNVCLTYMTIFSTTIEPLGAASTLVLCCTCGWWPSHRCTVLQLETSLIVNPSIVEMALTVSNMCIYMCIVHDCG